MRAPLALLAIFLLSLGGCGGGGSSGPGPTYNIGVTVAGLAGAGLVLALNGSSPLTIADNGSATFSSTLSAGARYAVTVTSQPSAPTQLCTVANGTGTVNTDGVHNITVTCVTQKFSLIATVSGLSGAGLELQISFGGSLPVTANGKLILAPEVASGTTYTVSIGRQPTSPSQTCTVDNGSGTIGASNVTNITISCVTQTFSVSVTVFGLAGSGLVLQLNGGDNLAISPNFTVGYISVTFSSLLPSGTSYAVTVATQPGSPTQICTLVNNSGVVTAANVTNITLSCAPTYNVWNLINGSGIPSYGTQGVASPSNYPPKRDTAVSWTDTAGNLWMFGGYQEGFPTEEAALNDLWVYTPNTGLWTWVSCSNVTNAAGVYGTQGVAAAGNCPGARGGAVSWVASDGTLWLFGGSSANNPDASSLNDLWRYDPATGLWTWMTGSSTTDAPGVYGTLGTAAPGNTPGSRAGAVSWTTADGSFWLFGGTGLSNGSAALLNDLWKFSPTTGLWTWESGSDTFNASAVLGTQGVAAAGNTPRASSNDVSWSAPSGLLWLFDGEDLWSYNPSNGYWTWVNGPAAAPYTAVYGTEGVGSVSNFPGYRTAATAWTGPDGSLWLFGGTDTTQLNDLWTYSPTTGFWTWENGQNTSQSSPSAREGAVPWTLPDGTLWLFGGFYYGYEEAYGSLDDFWNYVPLP
jgi:N-acetylneuraminic acid mutarotase